MPDRPPEPPFDPRYDRPRDPRFDPRDDRRLDPRDDPLYDPREGPRAEPRYDPRDDPRADPRYDPREDPRADPRYDPRENLGADPRYDPRQDSRASAGDDPRYDPRAHPEYARRDDPPYDPRYDPRLDRPREAGGAPPPPPPPPPVQPAPPSRPASRWRTLAIVAGLIGLLLIALFAYSLTRSGPGQDRLDEGGATTNGAGATSSAERCGTQRTYDLVKRELFRRAGQERGSDQSAFDRLSAYATVRVEAPVLKRQDEELGTQVCSGRVSIDLPPGVAVVGGRRTLTADVDYALQPAADRSGDVVTLSGAEQIIVPLATLARTGSQPGVPQVQPPAQPELGGAQPGGGGFAQPAPAPVPAPPQQPAEPRETAPPAPRTPPQASARPSFNCSFARTRGEVAVCNDPGLAALDRQMAGFYVRSLREGNATQRALLQRTRGSFLAFRDSCRSDSCVAGAYRDRMREIADIMADRWVAPR